MAINIKLKDQQPDEVVIRVVRRDAIMLVMKIAVFIFILAILAAGLFLVNSIFPEIIESEYFPIIVLFGYGFGAFASLVLFLSISDHVMDVWYITNKRVIDIQQDGFFSRKIAEQYLNRIQDVKSETVGVMPTIFRYGDVMVQTAGEHEQFLFKEVPEPDLVRQTIMELIQQTQNAESKQIPQ